MPTFEFIDLPGIQTLLEEDRVMTEGLVQQYIRDPNTLVLCVVEATEGRLDNSNALKIVSQQGKLPSTILALTKADQVHEDNI